jgi:hypothetical protein
VKSIIFRYVTPCSLLEVYFYQIVWRDIPEDSRPILQRHLVRSVNMLVCLGGLVVRVSGYRSRDPGFDSRRFQIF